MWNQSDTDMGGAFCETMLYQSQSNQFLKFVYSSISNLTEK